ncbi:cytochrome P450 [Actinoalloteichus spitiensis]|uniref:cytochrome P450 n=1 Tax=Actinoalloteichus spitiensis TaxID=252394 RepID=UPI00037CF95B|nr:cytochrome P450 [Actinoalloteichus spitiensis]
MTDATPVAPGLPLERQCPFSPPPGLNELRDHRPVSRMTYPDGHEGWLVTGHAQVREVLANPRFSSRGDLARAPIPMGPMAEGTKRFIPRGALTRMDPPEHTRYRRLLTGEFTVRRMRTLEPMIERIVDHQLDLLADRDQPADLVADFALPVPSLVICALLGVPPADRPLFERHTRTLFTLDTPLEERNTALRSLTTYLGQLVEAKRANPEDDLLSGLVAGGELDDEELATIGVVLLVAGHETTANMLAHGAFALLQHPDQLALLRSDPALLPGAVEELLRYLSVIHVGPIRTALDDIELDGHLIRAGESVTVSVPAANWDPTRFPEPDRLDITRRTTGHLAFGHGIHQCLGQQLARVEMRIGFGSLLSRFPGLRLAVTPDEVPLRSDMGIYGVHRLPVAW